MRSIPLFIATCILTLVGHFQIRNQAYTTLLKERVEVSEQARKIEHNEVRDLMFQLQEEKGKNEFVAAQSFVAGVVDTLNRPDYYQEIWHSGYDRGTEVQKYADSTKSEAEAEAEAEAKTTTQLGY